MNNLLNRKFWKRKNRDVFRALFSGGLAGLLILSSGPLGASGRAQGRGGMVVSADVLASEVGAEVLRQGGNAVDAAVAVGFALAVVFPQAGNLGGGGFTVLRLADGTATTWDFREKAPAGASRDMYLDKDGDVRPGSSLSGALAAGVPGTVAGLLKVLEARGTWDRAAVLAPAIKLARKGFDVSPGLAFALNANRKGFLKFPSSQPVFVGKRPWKAGDRLVQKTLAKTLGRIAKGGREGFYAGPTAEAIVRQMTESGGIITLADLTAYQPVERPPVRGWYRNLEVLSMGPPSSGGVALLQLLAMAEKVNWGQRGWVSASSIHWMAEMMRRVYADRASFMGDPDFVKVPVEGLLSPDYVKGRARRIKEKRATPSRKVKAGKPVMPESAETTHYSILDAQGNMVSVTTTLNSAFGCKLVVKGGGFFLNNEMDDFSLKPGVPNQYGLVGQEANAIEAHKRMLSSMTPTLLLKDNKPFMVLGSPGGPRIITTVFQVIVNVVDYGFDLGEAVAAPRVHHQWLPDHITVEQGRVNRKVLQTLQKWGHSLQSDGAWGRVQAIHVDSRGRLTGVADPRGYGAAVAVD